MALLDDIQPLHALELDGRRVFIRVDFDVPRDVESRCIIDDSQIRMALPTIEHAMKAGGKVIIGTHVGYPGGKPDPTLSAEAVGLRLAELTGHDVLLSDEEVVGDSAKKVVADMRPGAQLCLLENLRFHPGEEARDDAFAHALRGLIDVYINECWSMADQDSASTTSLPRHVPDRAAGLDFHRQLTAHAALLEGAQTPSVAILGGETNASRWAFIDACAQRFQTLCFGGSIANTLLAARGANLGNTPIETAKLAEARTLLNRLQSRGITICLPTDLTVADDPRAASGRDVVVASVPPDASILDIGAGTLRRFAEVISGARTVFWSGPLGVHADTGTRRLAEAIAECAALSLAAGPTLAPILRRMDPVVRDEFDLITTSDAPAEALLRGRRLPAVDALRL